MADDIPQTEQLRALTREMLDCASQGDWERLVELEKTRLPIFQQVFASGVSGRVELAREVLAMDERTHSLAAAGLPAIQEELLKLRNCGKARNAYQSIQDSAAPDR